MSKNFPRGADLSPAEAGATAARLPLTSADPLAPRYEQLKALFPMAVADGRMDFEKLRALMGDHATGGPERYGLSWAGKSDALRVLRQLTTATLTPAPSESVNWDATDHAIIEGDNLEVLKVLQHAYHGKVKLIRSGIEPRKVWFHSAGRGEVRESVGIGNRFCHLLYCGNPC